MKEIRALDFTVGLWDRIKFYPRFWFRRAFLCPLGKHQWRVFYITDGTTWISCDWCRSKREPTAEEAKKHPNAGLTPEQLARKQEQIEKAQQWLRENGFS
jgi:hypothetical protein